ncbi:MAG: aromatic-ring-hydroxylating dioxygenase subunit beta [Caulobacteraceae bacterium]
MPANLADIATATKTDVATVVDIETERAVTALIYKAARLTDERDFVGWMELFTDDGEYSAVTQENLSYKGLRLFRDVGRNALYERVAYLMGVWQVPRAKTLHLVSNVEISAGEHAGGAQAVSNFIMTRTADLEHTVLHAAGRYIDRFERRDGAWRFTDRLVVVDSNMLPPEFTELL